MYFNRRAFLHTHTHTHTHTRTHARTHAHTHARTYTRTHTRTHAHTHTHARTHAHTHTHTHTHARTHTHTHTHISNIADRQRSEPNQNTLTVEENRLVVVDASECGSVSLNNDGVSRVSRKHVSSVTCA